jgi:hemerythrin-like domain-containing protein
MKPIGPLMWEHRLIERMVGRLEKELGRATGKDGSADPGFIVAAVDFFRVYGDRTHHGKEEDILFKHLAEKEISPEHRQIMDELIQEHRRVRQMVGSLERAGLAYGRGDAGALGKIVTAMRGLTALYPAHIQKEDKRFFFPVMEYFTSDEQDAMLREFWEFDRARIHEKYRVVVEGLEGK